MTILDPSLDLWGDLAADMPAAARLQKVVEHVRDQLDCGAVGLLRLESDGEHLQPVAVAGLSADALGRRFLIREQPRLAAVLRRGEVTRFQHDSELPDPYDGLLLERPGEVLPVHDCMGVPLKVDAKPWGVLTLDSLATDAFGGGARAALQALVPLVQATLRVTELEAALHAAQQLQGARSPGPDGDRREHEIVGHSEVLTRLLDELEVVATSDLPILLMGETGSGKELFAHRLHKLSRRAGKPMVQVNCAALPESLVESELFGHVRGAFSGAISDRPGRFEAADGGTIFLDEVGELPLSIQAKLLRTLQNGEIQRLGADRPRKVDVRLIAATNRSLQDQVRDHAFRIDLYHRLSVYPLTIPPLRERGEDVLLLAGRFLELNRARLGLRALRLGPRAEEALRRYRWPGNVRELEHVISRAALKALSRGAVRTGIVTITVDLLDLDELPTPAGMPPSSALGAGAEPAHLAPLTLRERVDACQRESIREALALHGQQWAAAARSLGIDPSNLRKLARRLGLAPN